MWHEPKEERLDLIPRLYETESIPPKDKIVYLHFFIGASDWYIAKYDGEDLFFGYAILNDNEQNAEWGYISFTELREININGIEIDCELPKHWIPTPASQIQKIRIMED